MNLAHKCTDAECPYLGQSTDRGCLCHRTELQIAQEVIGELREAWQAIFSDIGSVSDDGWYTGYVHITDVDRLNAALARCAS